MSEFTKRIQDGTIPFKVSKTPCRGMYHMYGSIKKFDQLVDSPNIKDRIEAAKMGYGLEELMDDPSAEVQEAVLAFLKPEPEEYLGRGLHSPRWWKLFEKKGVLYPLLIIVKNDSDLVLQIRNNYINIYYKGGNMLKITPGPGFIFDCNYFKGFGVMNEQDQKGKCNDLLNIIKINHDFDSFVREAKSIMNAYWDWLDAKGKSLEEKNEQHFLSICNHEKTEYTVIDLEFQVSTLCDYSYKKPPCPTERKRNEKKRSPRFDIIAVRNSDKRLCVIELKKGVGALASKNSGVGDHADSFEGSILRDPKSFIREINKIVNDKKRLHLLSETFSFNVDEVEFMYAYAFSDPNRIKEEKDNMLNIMKQNKCDYNVIFLDINSYRLK